jgi:hypothetical protein
MERLDALLQFARGPLDTGFIGGVEQQELDLEAVGGEFLDRLFSPFGGAGAENDMVAEAGELSANFEADAFVTAGDEDGLGGCAHAFDFR